MFKMRCGIPNAYILDITMYKMHVSLCYYYTIRILISKTLTGTYEGGYTYVFEMFCYRTSDIVIYIYKLLYILYIKISKVLYMYIYINLNKEIKLCYIMRYAAHKLLATRSSSDSQETIRLIDI